MINILFVDDEPELLDGLRNRLWRKWREWHMVFALGGEAALEALGRHTFDVVVSDVRMPGVDGIAVLERVRRDQPTAVRILLSGETGVRVTRHLQVAQQILGKPCPIELLEETIARTQRVRALISDLKIQRRVGELAIIPSVPELVTELDDVLMDPNGSLLDAERVILKDPGLAARVLQVANSGVFGAPRVIHSIEESVAMLGIESLKAIALVHEMRNTVTARSPEAHARLLEIQQHSLAVARVATRFFEDAALRRSAFAAGLLHEIGTTLLDPEFTAHPSRPRIGEDDPPHCAVGAYAVAIWGLPYSLVEAVLHHLDPWNAVPNRFDLPAAIYVANLLVEPRWPGPLGKTPEESELNMDYLESIDVARRLPGWRAMVEEMGTEQRSAA